MKRILIGFACFILMTMPIRLQAIEEVDTVKVVISFDLTAEDRFIYEVRVSDGGSLYDGSQRITNGIMEYQLSVGGKKEFKIEANTGYEVKEIKVNGRNIDTDIEGITITGISANSVLEVKFKKIESTIPPDIDNPDTPDVPAPPNGSNEPETTLPPYENFENTVAYIDEQKCDGIIPVTGDILRVSEYICLMLLVFYRMYVSNRGIDTYSRVGNIAFITNETTKEEKKDEK